MRRSGRFTVLIVALLTGACRSEPQPGSKPVTVGWRHIETFSGHGNSLTESFNIESGQFRIKWETSHETSAGKGAFVVMVHSAVSGRPLMMAVEHKGVGHDTAYVNEDPRLFQLVIESNDLDWTVTVEEAVPVYSGLFKTFLIEDVLVGKDVSSYVEGQSKADRDSPAPEGATGADPSISATVLSRSGEFKARSSS